MWISQFLDIFRLDLLNLDQLKRYWCRFFYTPRNGLRTCWHHLRASPCTGQANLVADAEQLIQQVPKNTRRSGLVADPCDLILAMI